MEVAYGEIFLVICGGGGTDDDDNNECARVYRGGDPRGADDGRGGPFCSVSIADVCNYLDHLLF